MYSRTALSGMRTSRPTRTNRMRRWAMSFLGSLLSGGKALISIFSLLIVTPIVTFYLINNWKGIVAPIDRAIPSDYRDASARRQAAPGARSELQSRSRILE